VLAWAASVQRANLYSDRTAQDQSDLKAFRKTVLTHLETSLLPTYRERCQEDVHVQKIEELVSFGTRVGVGLLGEDGYKFAVAQKLLNLQLKYLWCLGYVAEPPHCPIDRIVLDQTSLRGKLNWTEITSRAEYLQAIEAVRVEADQKHLSLAQWELEHYDRR